MKKKRLQFVAILIIMAFSLNQSASAVNIADLTVFDESNSISTSPAEYEFRDNEIYITVNEYDLYVHNLQKEKAALTKAGYSVQTIENSRTYEFENRILALGELSEDALAMRGYTNEQIKLIKEYDGTPLEEATQMRAALPTMTAKLSAGDCSTQHISVHLTWTWSAAPATYVFQDSVAVLFHTYNSSGLEIPARYHTSYTQSMVTYLNYLTGAFYSTRSTSLTSKNVFQHVQTKFDRLDDAYAAYVASGSFNCYLYLPDEINSSIAFGTFIFEYGCPRTSVEYSISYPAGISISFGTTVDVALHVQATVSSTGNLTVD